MIHIVYHRNAFNIMILYFHDTAVIHPQCVLHSLYYFNEIQILNDGCKEVLCKAFESKIQGEKFLEIRKCTPILRPKNGSNAQKFFGLKALLNG